MASSNNLKHSNQVRSSSSHENRGRSKAQMSLKKIIDAISSSRPSPNPCRESSPALGLSLGLNSSKQETEPLPSRGRGLNIDLNLSLEPMEEPENQNTGFSSGFGEPSNGNICKTTTEKFRSLAVLGGHVSTVDNSCHVLGKEVVVVEEEMRDLSDITYLQFQSSDEEARGKREKEPEKDRYNFDILVEAARVVSGNFGEEEENESAKGKRPITEEGNEKTGSSKCGGSKKKKKNERWMVEFYEDIEEDISPVVRSNRGRNQVIPSRYRDSVIEPLNKLSEKNSTKSKKK